MFALGDIWSIVFCIVLRVRSGFGMVIRSDISVWCSTIWMEKAPAIDIIFILLIHANGTVCSRCWEKKLHLKTWSTWATTVVCPQCCVLHKENPQTINQYLSISVHAIRKRMQRYNWMHKLLSESFYTVYGILESSYYGLFWFSFWCLFHIW